MRTIFVTMLLGIIGAPGLQADISVKVYRESMATNNIAIKYYVAGLGDGMSWMNTKLEMAGKATIYCQPRKLAITMENYIDILDQEIKREAAWLKDDDRIGLLLVEGLKETFPCAVVK